MIPGEQTRSELSNGRRRMLSRKETQTRYVILSTERTMIFIKGFRLSQGFKRLRKCLLEFLKISRFIGMMVDGNYIDQYILY